MLLHGFLLTFRQSSRFRGREVSSRHLLWSNREPVAKVEVKRQRWSQRLSFPRPTLMQYVPGTAKTTQAIGPTPMICPQRLFNSG